ncbi:cytidylyltransferase domain-containing protein [Psittacicella gerlachiana]|uniref:N-acylneuraminate cytidylyltransferase n=1 Tax=Psittacicella gerlachiana TaxID=2028574 RepID=A0A3A1YDN9_9GAMM|nr:acylneuraminate cytidylyltransferase family protein [Psittacicella gerlachiana]RIY35310.1 hypothetical protein CKF59_03730 [Psittacicella gerlachiana]
MTERKAIVIIPVRGNSKRLPGKNIRDLNGLPLVAHSILYAKLFPEIVTEVYVSTDNEEIAQVSQAFGAKVIKRPDELALDTSPTLPVLTDALLQLNDPSITDVILLQATNPLRERDLLKNVWQIYIQDSLNLQSLFSVTRSFAKLGKIIDNKYIPWNYQIGQRSQDLEPLYFEDGVIYISSTKNILNGVLLDENAYPYINHHLSVDIDTIEEFEHSEYLFSQLNIGLDDNNIYTPLKEEKK